MTGSLIGEGATFMAGYEDPKEGISNGARLRVHTTYRKPGSRTRGYITGAEMPFK